MIVTNPEQNSNGLASTSNVSNNDRQRSYGEAEKNMWSSMLDDVATGKKLPEKNLLVLGGDPESQKEFLETLGPELPKRLQERHRRKPPVANEFALGYTYQDVLDTDHEDILARLSIYFLSEPSSAFLPLVKPLFTPRTVPHTLIVLLLNWAEPWLWIRQLRAWILFLKETILSLDEDTKDVMDLYMKNWQQHGRGGAYDAGIGGTANEGNITLPLSPGEWDECLGLPLCVVCQNANKIEFLEKEQGWREEDFDFILQFLRTILMKHGASLVYTSVFAPNSLSTLIQSMIGIHSLLQKKTLKHNVIDRDRVLIPPLWDSWGKIRVLREGFDVEGISSGWSIDINNMSSSLKNSVAENDNESLSLDKIGKLGHVLPAYEEVIKDPSWNGRPDIKSPNEGVEIEAINMQQFLASQQEIMERLKAEEEKARDTKGSQIPSDRYSISKNGSSGTEFPGPVDDHVGPIQFNFGGIQVDSEGMLTRSKGQAEANISEPEAQASTLGTPDGKAQNEALASFFAGLLKPRTTHSPKPTS